MRTKIEKKNIDLKKSLSIKALVVKKINNETVKHVPKRAGMNFVHLGLPEEYPGKQTAT